LLLNIWHVSQMPPSLLVCPCSNKLGQHHTQPIDNTTRKLREEIMAKYIQQNEIVFTKYWAWILRRNKLLVPC
jgi:hypothetical protein